MFKKILFCTDFSEDSHWAFPCASRSDGILDFACLPVGRHFEFRALALHKVSFTRTQAFVIRMKEPRETCFDILS